MIEYDVKYGYQLLEFIAQQHTAIEDISMLL